VDELQGMFETPKGIGEFRIDQQNMHRCLVLSPGFRKRSQPILDFSTEGVLAPQLGGNGPIGDPLTTLAYDELCAETFPFGCRDDQRII
jgi:hypothetical protein